MDDDLPDPPVADTSLRRVVGIVAIIVAVGISCFIVGAWPLKQHKAPPISRAGIPVDFWDWGANRRLSDNELALLDELGSTCIYSLCGFIRAGDPEPSWEPEGRPSAPIPGKEQHLVVRIDAALARNMDPALVDSLGPIIIAGWQRNRTDATIGLQIDCDVPTKRLPEYIAFLQGIRALLPADMYLSCTALVDWIRSEHLAELMHTVDLIAPQFYNTYLPVDPSGRTPLLSSDDLEWAIPILEHVGRPYRLGLPTYEQCSLYAADNTLLKPALPISPEQALSAGAIAIDSLHGRETILRTKFSTATTIGERTFTAGQQLVFAAANPAGLGHEFSIVRRLRPNHCLGVLLFRLPGREATHSLSITQIYAAATASTQPTRISARLEPLGNNHYALIIHNAGDLDFIDFTNYVRVRVRAPEASIAVPILPTYGFAKANVYASSNAVSGPDTLEVNIGLLRAGDVLKVEDVQINRDDNKAVKLHGIIERGDWSARF